MLMVSSACWWLVGWVGLGVVSCPESQSKCVLRSSVLWMSRCLGVCERWGVAVWWCWCVQAGMHWSVCRCRRVSALRVLLCAHTPTRCCRCDFFCCCSFTSCVWLCGACVRVGPAPRRRCLAACCSSPVAGAVCSAWFSSLAWVVGGACLGHVGMWLWAALSM